MYAIAKHLTLEQRRKAAASTYDKLYPYSAPRNPEGYCPLGLALEADVKDPYAGKVAQLIVGKACFSLVNAEYESYCAIEDAAKRFINDWDTGKITDVARAMGVKPQLDSE